MAAASDSIQAPNNVKIVKWKVRKESHIFKGTVLALYSELEGGATTEIKKLKATRAGVVADIPVTEGNEAKKGDVLLIMRSTDDKTCSHPTIMKDMCAECGMDLRENLGLPGDRKTSISASVAMVHSIPELIVSQEQALEIGKEDESRLLRQRKLVLLVDLDQTLIHTTNDNIPPNLKDVKHFQLWHGKNQMWYHTRFRPFTLRFIEAVSKMYELHICTFGVRMYAHIIARFLDPDEKYFSHRILSRDECFDAMSKTANLKALFPCGDKTVCIIDDREDVWNFAPNLVHVKPYRFFQGTADINAPPGLTKKEHDDEPLTHREVHLTKDKPCKENSPSPMTEEPAADADTIKTDEKTREASTRLTDKKVTLTNTDTVNSINSNLVSSQKSENVTKTTNLLPNEDEEKNSGKDSMRGSSKEMASMKENVDETPKEIEWDDTDDYLLHLEEILTRIHTAFYDMYEQSQKNGSAELPDLKSIVPYVRKKVLKGAHVVFSGMVPLNMPLEKSRAYVVATALGASIQTDIVVSKTKNGNDITTHLVAAKAGTGKHKSALKLKGLHIVSADWLWACSERWEWVDESLFPLHNHSPNSKVEVASKSDDVSSTNDEATVNPICSFSDEELVSMDKEVDLFLEGEDDNSSDETDDERDKRMRKNVLGSGDDSDSDSESLSGEFPRGWKLRKKSFKSPEAKDNPKMDEDRSDAEEEEEDIEENELEKNVSALYPEESCSSNSADSIGSVDDEIAEAVEKEFLASF
ncbi:hypothetical protein EGW08_008065, partial [Elysia chlorotica]